MKWRHGPSWPKPSIDGNLVLIPLTQATVVREANVLLQFWDLARVRKQPYRGVYISIRQKETHPTWVLANNLGLQTSM